MKLSIVLTLIFGLYFCQESQCQEIGDILNRYYQTSSNSDFEQWQKIKSVYIETESNFDVAASEGQITAGSQDWAKGRYFKIWPEISRQEYYNESELTSLFITKGVKMKMRIGNIEMDKELGREFYDNFEFEPVWVSLLEKKGKLTYEGRDIVSERDLHIVKCTYNEFVWRLYFDIHDHLLYFWSRASKDEENPSITHLNDYREVDGLMIPFSVQIYRNQILFYSRYITSIHLNLPLDRKTLLDLGKPVTPPGLK